MFHKLLHAFVLFALVFQAACVPLAGTLEVGVETPIATEPMVTKEPVNTEEPPSGNGFASGRVCYPSEFIPAMTAYFKEVNSSSLTEIAIAENQGTYTVELAPGAYQAFAWAEQMQLGGAYTGYVTCGFAETCTDHTLATFEVQPGQETTHIDICDWPFLREQMPAPIRSAESSSHPLSGLIYSDLPANSLNQIGSDGVPFQLLDVTSNLGWNFAISPDSKQLVYVFENDLWFADTVTGERRNLTNTPDRGEAFPQWWAARPGVIVFTSWILQDIPFFPAGNLTYMQLDGSNYSVVDLGISFTAPSLSADGNTIAYDVEGSPRLYTFDPAGISFFDVSTYGLNPEVVQTIYSPSFSPDGSKLAWWSIGSILPDADNSASLIVFDLPSSTMQIIHSYIPISMEGWIGKAAWSPDNTWIAAITMGERTRADLWVMHADGTEKHDLGSNVSDPVWSPDGQLVFNQYPNSGSFLEQQILTITPGNWTQLRLDELPMGSIPVAWGTPAR